MDCAQEGPAYGGTWRGPECQDCRAAAGRGSGVAAHVRRLGDSRERGRSGEGAAIDRQGGFVIVLSEGEVDKASDHESESDERGHYEGLAPTSTGSEYAALSVPIRIKIFTSGAVRGFEK